MKHIYLSALFLSISLLTGCGGSSSSSNSTPPLAAVTINSTNATTVVKAAVDASSQDMGKDYASNPNGVQVTSSAVKPTPTDRILYKLAEQAAQILKNQNNSLTSVTGVATTITNSCLNGGSYTLTSDGQSSSTITYNQCSNVAGTSLNGSYSMSNIAYVLDGNSALVSFTATASFNLTHTITGQPTIKLNGGYTFSLSGLNTTTWTFRLYGSSFVVSVNNVSDSLTNFDFQSTVNTSTFDTSDSVKYTASSEFLGASFSVETTDPIVKLFTDIYPRSGTFIIYGANSTALRVTILPTSGANTAGTSTGLVKLEISNNTTTSSAGTWTDLYTPYKTWADFQ